MTVVMHQKRLKRIQRLRTQTMLNEDTIESNDMDKPVVVKEQPRSCFNMMKADGVLTLPLFTSDPQRKAESRKVQARPLNLQLLNLDLILFRMIGHFLPQK